METLEAPTHTLVEVFAGTLYFTSHEGSKHEAKFFVHCEPQPEPDDPDYRGIMERRTDAFNIQYMEVCNRLIAEECTGIMFASVKPHPFF